MLLSGSLRCLSRVALLHSDAMSLHAATISSYMNSRHALPPVPVFCRVAFLRANGTFREVSEIPANDDLDGGGFPAGMGAQFGWNLANLGDIDGKSLVVGFFFFF